jgi:hypothetical protein
MEQLAYNIEHRLAAKTFDTQLLIDYCTLIENDFFTQGNNRNYLIVYKNLLRANVLDDRTDQYSMWMNDTANLRFFRDIMLALFAANNRLAYMAFMLFPEIIDICEHFSTIEGFQTFMNYEPNIIINLAQFALTVIKDAAKIMPLFKYRNTFEILLTATNSPTFLNQSDTRMRSVVITLIEYGEDDKLEQLVRAFPNTPVNFKFPEGNTLQLACSYGCFKLVDMLLQQPSALFMAMEQNKSRVNAVYYAASHSQQMLQKFLHFPDNLFDIIHLINNKTPLWHACFLNMTDILPQVIQKTPTLIHGLHAGGFTPLMLCCKSGNVNAAMALIGAGSSNMQYHSKRYGNALHESAKHTNTDALCETILNGIVNTPVVFYNEQGGLEAVDIDYGKTEFINFNNRITQNSTFIFTCKNRLRATANALLNMPGINLYQINAYNMDALCYCFLNGWAQEIELITKNNIKAYVGFLKLSNIILAQTGALKNYMIMLRACAKGNSNVYRVTQPFIKTFLITGDPLKETFSAGVTAFSSVEGGDESVQTVLDNGGVVFLHENTAYATTTEFIINVLQDNTKLKYACTRAIADIGDFNEQSDIYGGQQSSPPLFISLTLFGLPSGVMQIFNLYSVLAYDRKIFRLIERSAQPQHPAMMSLAYMLGISSVGADHCQPDANGNPFIQQEFELKLVNPVFKRASEPSASAESVELQSSVQQIKKNTPSFIAKVKNNTYPIVVGQTSTLQQLYNEIIALQPGATTFKIIFGGQIIKAEELLASPTMSIAEFEKGGRKIFSGDGLVLQIMFTPVVGGKQKRTNKRRAKYYKKTKKAKK